MRMFWLIVLIVAIALVTKDAEASNPEDHVVVMPTKPGASTRVSPELWIGYKIYERAFGRGCGACHDISSNPQLLAEVPGMSHQEFRQIMENGKNGMPSAIKSIMRVGPVRKAKLTETEAVDALYDYIQGRSEGNIPPGKIKKIK